MDVKQLEDLIQELVSIYGSQLWWAFVTMVATGFAILIVKNFITDLAYYFKARMSDIGYGQRVYYNGEIFIVQVIKFKYILMKDDKMTVRIPIKEYMDGPILFPHPRYDDTDEKKYHQKPWDGVTERRRVDH